MSEKYFYYGDLEKDDFKIFLRKLSLEYERFRICESSFSIDESAVKLMNKLSGDKLLTYSVKNILHKWIGRFLVTMYRGQDTSLINEMVKYNAQFAESEMEQRIRIDIETLMIIRGRFYYEMAWNSAGWGKDRFFYCLLLAYIVLLIIVGIPVFGVVSVGSEPVREAKVRAGGGRESVWQPIRTAARLSALSFWSQAVRLVKPGIT